jgi:hypothetical protein
MAIDLLIWGCTGYHRELHEGNNTLRADERSCLHGYLPATLGRSDLYEFKNL